MSGIYVTDAEIEEAEDCGCEVCQRIVSEGVSSPDEVGYLIRKEDDDEERS